MSFEIDRLTLRLSGMSEADGRRLVALIGERLATAASSAPIGTHASMRVSIAAQAGEPLESTAQRVASEMLRIVMRST